MAARAHFSRDEDDDLSVVRRLDGSEVADYFECLDEPFDDAISALDEVEPEPEPEPEPAPFSVDAVLRPYLTYLTAQRVDEQYLPHFEAEALALCMRFHRMPVERIDAAALELYLDEARAKNLPERVLRNRGVACAAFLGFLKAREAASAAASDAASDAASARRQLTAPLAKPPSPAPLALAKPPSPAPLALAKPPSPLALAKPPSPLALAKPPSPATIALAKPASPADKRRDRRINFLTEVHVDGLGILRCSDLSVGGMYMETGALLHAGMLIHARFKLRAADVDFIAVTARVTFVHPPLGAGVEFTEIAPHNVARIVELIARTPP